MTFWVAILTILLAATVRAEPASVLAWDALEKNHRAQPGETEVFIPFTVTNRSAAAVQIRSATSSCHCTSVVFPREPWELAPGASDTLKVRLDLRSRRAGLNKTIYVDTSVGEQILMLHVEIPPPPAVLREMNVRIAAGDRQAVLRGSCASCHAAPAEGKQGAELFVAVCMVCHGAANRAAMVPDLMQPTSRRDAAYWTKWIREGSDRTLMPAFAKANGGILDDAQIRSLVEFVTEKLPAGPEGE